MGAGRSKSFPISYEDACKRVPEPVFQRLLETFKRLSTSSGYLPQLTFTRDVLGDSVPPKLAEAIYESFGGGQKGIGYKDLLCGLVLLVYGERHEKARFIGQLVCEEGEKVTRERLDSLVIACDLAPPRGSLDTLFRDSATTASLDYFEEWILEHPHLASFSEWLLGDSEEGPGLSLEGAVDPPSFHQTLAGRFGVEEQVIMDIEKTYWSLKGGGKFDTTTLQSYTSPPLPADLCSDLFREMDLNLDGHIDLTELIQMVAQTCRGSTEGPHKLGFHMFDQDGDELLSREELVRAITLLVEIREANLPHPDTTPREEEASVESLADQALLTHAREKDGHMTESEYLSWASECELGGHLVKILVEICHVRFGLRPLSPELEGMVVNGYLNRFHKSGRRPGDIVYIIPSEWFTQWKVYTAQEEEAPVKPSKKHKRKHKARNKSHQLAPPTQSTSSPHSTSAPAEFVELNSIGLTTTDVADTTSSSLRPSAIDNSVLCVPEPTGSKRLPSLTNEGGRLVRGRVLMEGKDYVVLPEVVWRVFVTWYGNAGFSALSLPRIVGPEGEIDLYPLVFKLYRHTTNPAPVKSSNLPWPLSSLVSAFVNSPPSISAPLLSGDDSTQTPQPRRVPQYQAAFPKTSTLAEVCEVIQGVLRVKAEDLRLYNYSSDEPLLLENESATLEELKLTDGEKLLVETRNRDNSWPEEIIAIMKEVIIKDKDKPRPSVSEVKVPQGATGLSNLGNTCFMNSALQCVSSTRPLTTYFREKDHLAEINKDNPLGTGGVLAKRYGELVDDLWTGNSKSITPLKFRFTVGRYAPQFNGFQQQDCQELLAFLLDGLHEDLNRVKDKAYRELDDSDGRADEVVAKEAWDYHLSRNQSIVVDLFQGQLKSMVTCKVCQFTSVRFDPFTFLSLPLPMESTVNLEVIVVLLDGTQPMKYGLKLELDDKYRHLKRALSELCGLETAHMLLVEVYGGVVRSIPPDSTKIRSILGGWLYAYEIPPALTVAPTTRADSPDEMHRQLKVAEVRRERAMSLRTLGEERKRAKIVVESLQSHDKTRDVETESPDNSKGPESQDMEIESPEKSYDNKAESHDNEPESCDNEPKSHDMETEPMETEPAAESCDNALSSAREAEEPVAEQPQSTDTPTVSHTTEPVSSGLEGSDGFVFAIHRRMFSVEHFFVSSQKSRPVIFGTPLVVPCEPTSPRHSLYECVWEQVQRLMIPDPPNKHESPDHHKQYPFILKLIAKDGVSCGQCPWYRFCNGCPLVCDSGALGRTSGYIGVDWDTTTLHLKYQSVQERPLEHESMESLKVIDTKPIDLYDCFKAFVRQDELGDEESWYCKQCKTHREAVKSLEIWKLPPVLIIHLKRFQFFNGRWVKSQRDVTFPLMNLDPCRHTARNSNGQDPKHQSLSGEESCEPQREKPCESGDQGEQSYDTGMEESCDTGMEESCDNRNDIQEASTTVSSTDVTLEPTLYDLFAICCHSGVMGGGHYVSFAKNPNSKWYYFNDSSCKETTEERVLEESPYLLFYELKGLEQDYNRFRSKGPGGKGQEVGTEDDREFEQTMRNLRKTCTIQ